jgi:hypothetical protein
VFFLISLFSLLLIFDISVFVIIGSIDGTILLIIIVPLTLIIYGIFLIKSQQFTSEDPLVQSSGKLYYSTAGLFKATIIAILHSILGGLIIPDSSFQQLEFVFGSFGPIIILFLLPMPGIILSSLKSTEYQRI